MATKKAKQPKKKVAKKTATKAGSKKSSKKKTVKAEAKVETPSLEADNSAETLSHDKKVQLQNKKVWDEKGVPKHRRGENIHEDNPGLQAEMKAGG